MTELMEMLMGRPDATFMGMLVSMKRMDVAIALSDATQFADGWGDAPSPEEYFGSLGYIVVTMSSLVSRSKNGPL